jgi:hypothetical protein
VRTACSSAHTRMAYNALRSVITTHTHCLHGAIATPQTATSRTQSVGCGNTAALPHALTSDRILIPSPSAAALPLTPMASGKHGAASSCADVDARPPHPKTEHADCVFERDVCAPSPRDGGALCSPLRHRKLSGTRPRSAVRLRPSEAACSTAAMVMAVAAPPPSCISSSAVRMQRCTTPTRSRDVRSQNARTHNNQAAVAKRTEATPLRLRPSTPKRPPSPRTHTRSQPERSPPPMRAAHSMREHVALAPREATPMKQRVEYAFSSMYVKLTHIHRRSRVRRRHCREERA